MANLKGPLSLIAVPFIGLGAACLALSIFYFNQILAFVGLGLTFWGAIFVFTRVGNVVKASLMDNTAKSTYSTINRIMKDYKFSQKGYYLPAYPSDVILPNYMLNLKDSIVFITNEVYTGPPSVDDMVKGKFLSSKNNGIFITAPGNDLLSYFEADLKVDLTKIKASDMCEVLPRSIIEANLAKTVKMKLLGDNRVSLEVSPLIYRSLYVAGPGYGAVNVLGCPIVSAVACALAKNFVKAIAISEQKISGDKSLKVEVLFEAF
jgi:hypothetical protein